METALYGRMRLGRCVKTDFGFVGCYTDVLKVPQQLPLILQICELRTVSVALISIAVQ